MYTARQDFTKLYSANESAASSITKPESTATEPSGNGIFSANYNGPSLGVNVPSALNAALFKFYGTDADNETFIARITGWRRDDDLWVPTPLLLLAGTLGASVGVAGKSVLNTERFADTITVTTEYTTAYEIISQADDSIALVKLDIFGSQYVQVQLAKGTCASVNVLAAGF